jgi:hypothetical protein
MRNSIVGMLGVLAAAALPDPAGASDLGECPQTISIASFRQPASTTSSQSFATVPGTTITRNTGNMGCTVVEFSAQVNAGGGARIRLIVDGDPFGQPSSVDLYSVAGATDQRTVRFTLPNLTSGMHTFAIQYMSIGGSAVSISRHTTILYFDNTL